MTSKPQSYEDALPRAQAILREARLVDPGEHYPYKYEHIKKLLAENPAAGRDKNDTSKRVSDFTSERIIDATKAYIEAQEAYLKDPGDATLVDYQAAAEDLVAARKTHRRKRGGGLTITGSGS